MSRRTVSMLTGMALVALPQLGFAQSSPQSDNAFVGTWKLNLAKSKFDPGPPVRSRTVTVEPAGDGVKWSIEQVDANGNLGTMVETPKFDGKDYPRTGTGSLGGGGDTIALKRIDAYTLEETLKKGGEVVATFTQVVSKDGKERTATQMTGTNSAGQPVHNVLVFDKQNR
jgi:hypothetical protein